MNPIINRFKYKSFFTLFLCFTVLGIPLGLQAEKPKPLLVLPFKVTPPGEKAHQWLGRAVSFYIAAGLQWNELPVISDQYTVAVLEMKHVMFPYNITKASVIRLARENRLDRVIWGEIILDGSNNTSAADKSSFQIRSFIIHLPDYSQSHLPLIKGNINDLYQIKNKLLTAILNELKPMEQESNIRYPQFNLNHRSYEIFIKSLLVKEPAKRIELLEKARNACQDENSYILDFELAKLYLNIGELEKSKKFLDKLPENKEEYNPIIQHEKKFLAGLLAYAGGDINTAVKAFDSITSSHLGFALHHNLGVIHLKRKDYETAEKNFRNALAERNDPETQLNLVYVLLRRDLSRQAAQQLYCALCLYPQEEKLVEMFSYFISQSPDQELLFSVFENYISNLPATEEVPMVSLELKNPFNYQKLKHNSSAIANETNEILDSSKGLRGLNSEDVDSWIERLQELLEVNPFKPDYYRLISLLYMKRKEFSQAELHALALKFLEKTRENYLHLLKVYKASKNKKRVKEIKKVLSQLE